MVRHIVVVLVLALQVHEYGQAYAYNLAFGKPTDQSSTWYSDVSSRAVDGNKVDFFNGDCSSTQPEDGAWWIVDLEEEFYIKTVVVTNRGDCCDERLYGFIVQVGMNESVLTSCSRNPGPFATLTITTRCEPPVQGRYVKISIPDRVEFLTLCEVEVFGQAYAYNLAFGKPTDQSSTWYSDVSSRAVDGNKVDFFNGDCSSTQPEDGAWWIVDLEGEFIVQTVVVTNREDCCDERLHGFIVEVGRTESVLTTCSSNPGPFASLTITTRCEPPVQGRYVKISIPDRVEFLTLCEVEVFELTTSTPGGMPLSATFVTADGTSIISSSALTTSVTINTKSTTAGAGVTTANSDVGVTAATSGAGVTTTTSGTGVTTITSDAGVTTTTSGASGTTTTSGASVTTNTSGADKTNAISGLALTASMAGDTALTTSMTNKSLSTTEDGNVTATDGKSQGNAIGASNVLLYLFLFTLDVVVELYLSF